MRTLHGEALRNANFTTHQKNLNIHDLIQALSNNLLPYQKMYRGHVGMFLLGIVNELQSLKHTNEKNINHIKIVFTNTVL